MVERYAKPVLWMIAVTLLCVLYLIRLPPQFESRGILLMDEVSFIVICTFIYFTLHRNSWFWKYTGLILTTTLFMVSLFRYWQTAESNWNIVLGLFPYLDASGYYTDAHRLIQGELFSPLSGHRPLFPSLLSIFLLLSRQNLQTILIIFALLNGAAAFLFGLEIRKSFGPLAGAIVIYMIQFFYRPFAGTLLTEQLGLPLGLAALTALIHSARIQNKWLYSIGLLLLTFALLVRAGAFFILPVLFFYGIYLYRKNSRDYLSLGILFVTAMIIPAFLNVGLGRFVASPSSVPFGNFADTLYGQAVGGKGWTQVMHDHPELAALDDPQRSHEIYRLAYFEIIRNPKNFMLGIMKSWKDFITPGISFGYLNFGNKTINFFPQLVAAGLFWVGIWFAWKGKDNPVSGLLLTLLIGTFLSCPFLPPRDGGMRTYSATVGVIFLPVGFALFKLIKHKNWITPIADHDKWVYAATNCGLALLIVIPLGAVLIKLTAPPPTIQTSTCSPGLVQANIRLTTGSYILLVNDASDHKTRVPVVLIKDVLRSFDDFPYGDFARVFRRIKQPALITFMVNRSTGAGIWLIAPPELANAEGRDVSICGELALSTQSIILISKSIQVY